MGWPVLGYLLGKNFWRRDRDQIIPPRRMDAAVCRAEMCYPFGRKHGRHWAMKRREFIALHRKLRDCAAADARHRVAIPPATETARPMVPSRLDGERLPQLRLHDGRQRPRRHGQLRPDGCNGIDSDLRTSAIASAASRAWSTFWAIRSKYGWTASPSTVSETNGLRWKTAPPSSCSNAIMALVSEGWETPQRLAARVKLRSSQSARK